MADSLEKLLIETEQKILNKDYIKEYQLNYEDEQYSVYIKPISQKELMSILARKKKDIAGINTEIMKKCLLKEDGSTYPDNLIEILVEKMPAGFATDISKLVYELSGINKNEEDVEEIKQFLE